MADSYLILCNIFHISKIEDKEPLSLTMDMTHPTLPDLPSLSEISLSETSQQPTAEHASTNTSVLLGRVSLSWVEARDACNTSFHDESAARGPDPSEAPYRYSRWLPLVQRSRCIPSRDVQTVRLSRGQTETLSAAAHGSIISRRANRAFEEDIEVEVRPALAGLTFPECGLFVRLDACSPKDGESSADGGRALRTVDDVILRLTTSQRVGNTLMDILDGAEPVCKLFFLPFEARIETRREYRVFCRPGDGRVTAVSQYQWHRPWMFSDRPTAEQTTAIRDIMRGVEQTRGQILEEIDATDKMDALLLRQGFTFDVFYDEGSGDVELVELNVFGARSACGSCLFHWIRDADRLSGEEEMVEFRVVWG